MRSRHLALGEAAKGFGRGVDLGNVAFDETAQALKPDRCLPVDVDCAAGLIKVGADPTELAAEQHELAECFSPRRKRGRLDAVGGGDCGLSRVAARRQTGPGGGLAKDVEFCCRQPQTQLLAPRGRRVRAIPPRHGVSDRGR